MSLNQFIKLNTH